MGGGLGHAPPSTRRTKPPPLTERHARWRMVDGQRERLTHQACRAGCKVQPGQVGVREDVVDAVAFFADSHSLPGGVWRGGSTPVVLAGWRLFALEYPHNEG